MKTTGEAGREGPARGMRPAEVEALGEEDDTCALRRRLADALDRAGEVPLRLSALDEHLDEDQPEGSRFHRQMRLNSPIRRRYAPWAIGPSSNRSPVLVIHSRSERASASRTA